MDCNVCGNNTFPMIAINVIDENYQEKYTNKIFGQKSIVRANLYNVVKPQPVSPFSRIDKSLIAFRNNNTIPTYGNYCGDIIKKDGESYSTSGHLLDALTSLQTKALVKDIDLQLTREEEEEEYKTYFFEMRNGDIKLKPMK